MGTKQQLDIRILILLVTGIAAKNVYNSLGPAHCSLYESDYFVRLSSRCLYLSTPR